MTSLTADDAMAALLSQATGLAEIHDQNGSVIGFFAPVSLGQARHYAEAAARVDRQELERRKANPGRCHTTREVFEHLLSLTEDERERADLQAKIDGLGEGDGRSTP